MGSKGESGPRGPPGFGSGGVDSGLPGPQVGESNLLLMYKILYLARIVHSQSKLPKEQRQLTYKIFQKPK